MLGRTVVAAMVMSVTLATGVPGAHALPWSGTCSLALTFQFGSPVRSATASAGPVSRPTYSIQVAPATDLNAATSAIEPCVIEPGGLAPFRTTSIAASGSSTVWTCEGTEAAGSWQQSWTPSPPPMVSGSHVITGGPQTWTLVIYNYPAGRYIAAMELTVHPADAAKLAQCELGGMTSLRMMGLLEFQSI